MKKALLTTLFVLTGLFVFSQPSSTARFAADCASDFWTVTATGYVQQWRLIGGNISKGDTILSGAGASLGYCGAVNAPTFYTDNVGPGTIGIDCYDADSGWVNIPTAYNVQDNGGHLSDQFYTVVGGVIQWVTYWNGTNLRVIDSLPGEFFAGIFDIAVDTFGHAWITTASSIGTSIDSLKVYDQNGQINAYSFPYDLHGYGAFFLNNTLYMGTHQDSIYPIQLVGNAAQPGPGIPFPSGSFTDMASCQGSQTITSVPASSIRSPQLFPNPTAGPLTVSPMDEKYKVSIYNSAGRLIEVKLAGTTLDLSEQANGIFYLRIDTDAGTAYHKVLKQ